MKSATRDLFDASKAPVSDFQLHVLRVQDVAGLRVKQLEFQAGINVIYGPNESGKSTLMQAIRTVLLQRAKAKDVARELSPITAAGVPTIWLEFSFAHSFYRLSKRFEAANTNAASLYCDDELIQGDEVDVRLAELFGFTQNHRGIAAHAGLLGLLWVEQADLSAAEIDGNADLSLRKGLNKMRAGAGFDSKALKNMLDEILSGLLGEKGKPVKEYARALRLSEELAQGLKDVERSEAQHVQNLHNLASLQQQLQQAKDSVEALVLQEIALAEVLVGVDAALGERAVRLQVFEQNRSQAEAHRAQLAAALDVAKDQLTNLQTQRRRFVESRAQAAQFQAKVVELEREQAALHASLHAKREEFATLDAEYQAALSAREHRYFQSSVSQAQRWQQELATWQAAHEEASQRFDAHKRSAHEREILSAALLAATTRKKQVQQNQVELQLIAGTQAIKLEVDGIELEAGTSVVVPAPTEVILEGGAKLRVSMPVPSNDRTAWETLRRQVRDLMRHSNYANEDAIAAVLKADVTLAELERAAHLLKRFGTEQSDAEMRRTEAARELSRIEHSMQTLPAEVIAAATDTPTIEASSDGFDDAAFSELSAQFHQAKRALEPLESAAHELSEKLRVASNTRDGQQQYLKSLREQMHDACTAHTAPTMQIPTQGSDDDAMLLQFDALLHGQSQGLDELHAKLAAFVDAHDVQVHPDPTLAAEQIAREAKALELHALRAKLVNEQTQLQSLSEEAARIEGRVLETGKIAWSQVREQQQARLQAVHAQVKGLTRRAEAASALSTRLQQAAQQFERQIQTPLRAAMKPYLQLCFGQDTDVTLEDNLRVSALIRRTLDGAQEAMTVERLSVGAREQLHILTRLAFADVLKANGSPSFLVLDDVFAYSDAQRKLQIARALALAASHHQIIISSCRAGEWDFLRTLALPMHVIELPARHPVDDVA